MVVRIPIFEDDSKILEFAIEFEAVKYDKNPAFPDPRMVPPSPAQFPLASQTP